MTGGGKMKNTVRLAKKTESEILFDKIFERYGIKLQNEIIEFLKENSRGVPQKKELRGTQDLFVASFVSLSEKDETNIFSLTRLLNGDNRDTVYIPIALDGFGGMFCLKYINKELQAVEYINEEYVREVFVCHNFKEFLEILSLL